MENARQTHIALNIVICALFACSTKHDKNQSDKLLLHAGVSLQYFIVNWSPHIDIGGTEYMVTSG